MVVGSLPLVGVILALISAFALAVGNLWQSRGVARATGGNSGSQSFWQLLKTPVWIGGTLMFGLAILLQMASLAFAPLILVQPIGVAALVFTALLTAKATGQKPSKAATQAIGITLVGVIAYVIIAAIVSKQSPITDNQLIEMLVTLAGMLIVSAIALLAARGAKRIPMLYVIIGGVFSGFVATLGKTVMLRVESMFTNGHFEFGSGGWLTVLCLIGIGIASAMSAYFVQYSHTCNSPESVIAGLTVIDPAVAVILGITILQEAAGAPMWTTFAFLIAGAVAFAGVAKLAKADAVAAAAVAPTAATGAANAAGMRTGPTVVSRAASEAPASASAATPAAEPAATPDTVPLNDGNEHRRE